MVVMPSVMPNPFPLYPLARHSSRRSSIRSTSAVSNSFAAGVGQPDSTPVESLSDVRRTDPRSAQIGGPDRVALGFQVRTYIGQPVEAKAARNLLSNDDWRSADGDQVAHDGPEVALVVGAAAASCAREGLTGGRAGPEGTVVGPSGKAGGETPASNAGK
jgi:hypothetical protein